MIGRRELLGGALILTVLVALFHGPALGGGFVYDDHWTIVDNAFIRTPANLGKLLTAAPARAGVPDAGRPALLATEILDHALWGLAPRGYHAQNLLWHLAIVLLFFAGLCALTGELMLALTAAGLFAVHPLGVEAVAAINYREDLLATFFTLAALLVTAAARRSGQGRGRARATAFLLLVVGGFAKENAAIAPILLAILDLSCGPAERWSRRLDQLVLLAAALVPIAWRTWALGAAAVVSHSAEIPATQRTLLQAVPRAAWSFLCGLGQLVVPGRFAADYEPPGAAWPGGLALGLILVAGALAFGARRSHRWLSVGVLGGIAAYLPTFGLLPISNLRADRYFYLPLLPLSLALATLLVQGLSRAPWLRASWFDLPRAWLVVGALLVALGLRTRQQARVWHDDLTLWTRATTVSPDASRAWTALAEARLRRGHVPGALAAVEHSLALANDAHARELLGIVLMEEGELIGAHRALEQALAGAEIHHRAEWLNNLGLCELRLGQLDAALARFSEARRLAPRYDRPWLNAARTLEQKGDLEGARRLLKERPLSP